MDEWGEVGDWVVKCEWMGGSGWVWFLSTGQWDVGGVCWTSK